MAPAASNFDPGAKEAALRKQVQALEAELAEARRERDAAIAARKAADERHLKASSIIDHSWSAVVTVNAAGVVDGWNEGAERLLGYTAAEMVGQPMDVVALRLVPSELAEEFHRELHAVRLGRTAPRYETLRIRKDGRSIRVTHNALPIQGIDGGIAGYAFVCDEFPGREQAEDS